MASAEDVLRLRRMVGEPGTETYTDEALSALLDGNPSVESVAAGIWQEKAARYADLVNVSESGSSRSLSDLHKNALRFADYYLRASGGEPEVVADAPMTVPITRP
jgi:hypothetical protein